MQDSQSDRHNVPESERETVFGLRLEGKGSLIFSLLAFSSSLLVGSAFRSLSSDWTSRVAIWLSFLILVTYCAAQRFSSLSLGILWYLLCLYVFLLLKLEIQLEWNDIAAIIFFALLSLLAYRRSGMSSSSEPRR